MIIIICLDHVVTNLQRSGVVFPHPLFQKACDLIARVSQTWGFSETQILSRAPVSGLL